MVVQETALHVACKKKQLAVVAHLALWCKCTHPSALQVRYFSMYSLNAANAVPAARCNSSCEMKAGCMQ